MYKMSRLASLVTLTLSACLITACSDGKDNADHKAKSGFTLVPQVETIGPSVKFGINLQSNPCSQGDGVIGNVTWQVLDPSVKNVKVLAGTSVFTYAGASGQQLTGPWIHKDSALVLTDASTGKQLAHLKMIAQPCTY